ncbi:hypothetical protein Tco_0117061 [Tanacetum coccineum]
MPPKRTFTSQAPAITQAPIKLMLQCHRRSGSTSSNQGKYSNPNSTSVLLELLYAKMGNYIRFYKLSTFLLQWTEGAFGLIRMLNNRISSSHSRCAEENKVTFTTGTLTDDALSW